MNYIPGNAAEGFCDKCKKDTVHTILEVDKLQVRMVRCEKCGHEGPLKMPRHKTKAGLKQAMAKKAGGKKRRTRKAKSDPGQSFRKMLEGKDISSAIEYSVKKDLNEGDVIKHKRFGIGVVSTITDDKKANVIFEDGTRTLIFSRG